MLKLDKVLTTTFCASDTLAGRGLVSGLTIKLTDKRYKIKDITNHVHRFFFERERDLKKQFAYLKSELMLVVYLENWSMIYQDECQRPGFQIYALHNWPVFIRKGNALREENVKLWIASHSNLTFPTEHFTRQCTYWGFLWSVMQICRDEKKTKNSDGYFAETLIKTTKYRKVSNLLKLPWLPYWIPPRFTPWTLKKIRIM